jgi:hypothetical protein
MSEGSKDCDKDAATALSEWRYVWSCNTPDTCGVRPAGQGDLPVAGLGVQIRARKGSGARCPEAVIAFRGTVGGDKGDWESNFHWILRAFPIYDQYDQVRDHIGGFINHIEREQCYGAEQTQIVAVGHSVGGGLAQLAAFSDPRIRHVYVFETSVTTGFYSVSPPNRDRNVQGLLIERIYEEETLGFWMRQFSLPSPCNPRIVDIQFNLIQKIRLTGDSMTEFTNGLLKEANGYQPETNPLIAQRCGEPPQAPLIADDAGQPSVLAPSQTSVPSNRMASPERPPIEGLEIGDTEQNAASQHIELARLFLILQSAVLTVTIIFARNITGISQSASTTILLVVW